MLIRGEINQFFVSASGFHSLPILLKVKDGKKMCLHLQGRTVSPTSMKLGLAQNSQRFILEPVPLGHPAPPMQMYRLRNWSPACLSYRLDLTPLDSLSKEHFGFEIIKFTGPDEGEYSA